MATMPHCDSRVLHAPDECEYCDAYPDWQRAREMWGIAFTGHPPTDKQPLTCPSEVTRPLDVINRWSGNRPTSPSTDRPAPDEHLPDDASLSSLSAPSTDHPTTQLGRPNIPVLKKNLEVLIREIVKDVLRDERNRGN